MTLKSRLAAEFIGTAFLLATVVGSGVMGEKLAAGNTAILVMAYRKELPWREIPGYLFMQLGGAFAGVVAAHVMFGLPVLFASQHERAGFAQAFSEALATFGLLFVILGCSKFRAKDVPWAVGLYITAAYWFTASTSFANPAVTLARSASDTFAGIRFIDVPAFVLAQVIGASLATVFWKWLESAIGQNSGESTGGED
jgi:glycerol uptake facilitator-like aquaporin